MHFEKRTIKVTHPFHPLFGKEFTLLNCKQGEDERIVKFRLQDGSLRSIPLDWCDLRSPDPYLDIGGGHSLFRVEDLLKLSDLIKKVRP